MPRAFSRVLCLLLIVAAGLIWQETLNAQTTATILGTVKDQSAAVLPGATVTATNVDTGQSRSAVSGSKGEFRIPALAVGVYEIKSELAGFQTGIRKGITLSIGQEAVVDLTLNVGNVAEQVTVTGEAALLETTTATVSGLVDPAQMREIPLNARSFIDLVPLQAGAVFVDAGSSSATNGFGRKVSITGSRPESNVFLLDGADMNDASNSAGSAAETVAGVETVREFRIITNAYDAEYGRHTGGVISAITKSGTNQFHGSLFEFLRNNDLDARNFFDVGGTAPFKRNQFGGSFGGPIRKDKTFFFGSYEGLRQRKGYPLTFNVPGFLAQNGLSPTGTAQPVSAATKPYMSLYPLPNVVCSTSCVGAALRSQYPFDRTDGTGQYTTSFTEPTTQNYWMTRIDHRFSDSDSIFGRVTFDSANKFTPGGSTTTSSSFNTGAYAATKNRFITAEETHLFSPALLSRTMASFNRENLALNDRYLPGFTPPKFNFSDSPDVPGEMTITGLTAWGGSNTSPKADVQNNFQFKQDFIYSKGRHSLKFGGQLERFQFNERSDFYAPGHLDFPSIVAFASGLPSAAHYVRPGSDNIRGSRQTLTGLYFQDDINLRPGLTLNAGVRYEFISVPTEVNGKLATIRNIAPAHFYTVTPDQTDTGNPYFVNPSLKNFAPRVGLSWSPSNKTVIRAGAGLFYEQIMSDNYITSIDRMPPYYAVAELFSQNINIDFPNGFVTQRNALIQNIGSSPQGDGFPFIFKQPVIYKWSMDVERQVAPDTTLLLGYSGTRGVHLVRGNLNLNSQPATTINGVTYVLLTQPVLNPTWARMRWRLMDGTSLYNALRIGITKRMSHSLQLQSSYTFSKSTDDSSSRNGGTDFGAADQAGYLGAKMHGLSSFDVRQSFFTSIVYDLPGRSLKGFAGAFLGGWSSSSILRFNSGYPLNPTAAQPTATINGVRYSPSNVDGSKLDLIPGGKQNPVHAQNPNQYFDVTQYTWAKNCVTAACTGVGGNLPVGFFIGNLGRDVLIGPGVANVDLTLNKDFHIPGLGEDKKLQFRAEAYNLFNRANFNAPATAQLNLFNATGVRVSSAGQITSTGSHNSRQLQFALKFAF